MKCCLTKSFYFKISDREYSLPKPKPRPRSFRTTNVTNDTPNTFQIDKQEGAIRAYKEEHHVDTLTSTSSDVTIIKENIVTSGHFVNFDKLVEHSTPIYTTIRQIDNNKFEHSNSRKDFTIDHEYRVDQGYKETSYIDVNRPLQAHSVEPYDVRKGVAEKLSTDYIYPKQSKEIVVVKEIDLKPLVVTHPKAIYSQKDINYHDNFENKEISYSDTLPTERLDRSSGVESTDFSNHPESKSSPESHYRYTLSACYKMFKNSFNKTTNFINLSF